MCDDSEKPLVINWHLPHLATSGDQLASDRKLQETLGSALQVRPIRNGQPNDVEVLIKWRGTLTLKLLRKTLQQEI